jgi:peptidoglycan/xylan/chitin deacetylase (PgdA/CDA1 family)/SAM-dependent methyltransferase
MAGIGVVLVCRDAGRWIPADVQSVCGQSRQPTEVVVLDRASSDRLTRGVLGVLDVRRVRVVRAPGASLGRALNDVIGGSRCCYFVVMAARHTLDATCLEKLADRLEQSPEAEIVTCGIRTAGTAPETWSPDALTIPLLLAEGAAIGAIAFRRTLWSQAGGLDESAGDRAVIDFCLTALAAGARADVVGEPLVRCERCTGLLQHMASGGYRPEQDRSALMEKHQSAVAGVWPDVLVARDAALERQRVRAGALELRRGALADELEKLRTQIARLQRAMQAAGGRYPEFGDLARITPISRLWGADRGKPIDRVYIDEFLARHRRDIHGRVLEIKNSFYTQLYGGDRVDASDVLDVDAANPDATIVADLAAGTAVGDSVFDCFILTQTLQYIFDLKAAVATTHRLLKPGGVVLCTVPALSRVDFEAGLDRDYWRFTEASVRALFAESFPADQIQVEVFGNVRAGIAFLHGIAAEELGVDELRPVDPYFPTIFGVRAVKRPDATTRMVKSRADLEATGGVILAYHRVATNELDTHDLAVSAEDFRAQMEHLASHYEPIALDQFTEQLAAGSLRPGAVAVTLDDGYLDALTTASPILMDTGVPATFFINSYGLSQQHETWWDTLERIFLAAARLPGRLEMVLDGRHISVTTGTWRERSDVHRMLHPAMLAATFDERRRLLEFLGEWSGLDLQPRPSHRLMTAPEVTELAMRPGHTIGGHSAQHLLLSAQRDDVIASEIGDNKVALERVLGAPVNVFCYPYGRYDARAVAGARAAGFVAAVTTEERVARSSDDSFLLPRFGGRRGGADRFRRRLRRWFELADVGRVNA